MQRSSGLCRVKFYSTGMRLELSSSGTYFNPSQGVFTTVRIMNSPLPMTVQLSRSNGGPRLSWNSQAGLSYSVLTLDSLNQANWTNQSGSIIATGPSTSWTDSNSVPNPQRFYRIRSP